MAQVIEDWLPYIQLLRKPLQYSMVLESCYRSFLDVMQEEPSKPVVQTMPFHPNRSDHALPTKQQASRQL